MTTGICPIPHRHDSERPRSASHGFICRGCHHRLERALAELPGLFDELVHALAPGRIIGARITGTPDHALPINPAVAEHRKDIAGKLSSWCQLVIDERGVTTAPDNDRPVNTAPWLLIHLDWLEQHDEVETFAAEVFELSSKAFSLAFPSGARRIKLGECVEPDCPGTLSAVVRDTDDLLPSRVWCDVDESHEWPADKWISLGRQLHEGAA